MLLLFFFDVSPIVGFLGVFLLCRHHVYMVENYFVNPNGDIVEVQDQEEEEEKPWDQAITDA